eukprot:gb/GEZN01003853.1/.p1 GENE.gb/GEZN01003853.1/~~gb/GEZN01003853.1/.p1  ORF type:complete len:531 (+),score=65.21 gb/GEZN01003853.1/:22-1614(+)
MSYKPDWTFPVASKEEILRDLAAKTNDGPSKCTWRPETTEPNPHGPPVVRRKNKIMNSILEGIGNTPMVRINSITKEEGVQCEVVVKCEFFNAGGSVKDRIGRRMIEDAEKSGRIKPGDTLIEPTSGNTGIGLALAAALKGYKMIITLPEKMSNEKVDVLKALGAEIWRTPTEAAFDSPESHIGVAGRLNKEIPNSHILDQYGNPSNPLAHYDETAEEILDQCDGKLDAVVIAAGTGGTITGIARKMKERLPNVKVIGVDPVGSILALPNKLNGPITSYQVEGTGYDFIPNVLDRSVVDLWIKTSDTESFLMARRMIKSEGLLCGGSSGSAMVAAIKYAKTRPKGERIVVILADSVRNYMSKFLNDGWMYDNGFMDSPLDSHEWWSSKTVGDMKLGTPVTVSPSVSCSETIEVMSKQGYDQLPVVHEGKILGVASLGNIYAKLSQGRIKGSDPISKSLFPKFKAIGLETKLGALAQMFNMHNFVLVVHTSKNYRSGSEAHESSLVIAVVTKIDLLQYIASKEVEGIQSKL